MAKRIAAEQWRSVVGYGGLYDVSNAGRVRSIDRFDCAGFHRSERMLSLRSIAKGYIVVGLTKPGNMPKQRPVHQLVAEAFIGPRPVGHQVNHKDGDKKNNCACNLEWASPRENKLHATQILGIGRGDTHGRSILSDEIVVIARYRWRNGESGEMLSKEFGVSKSAMYSALRGETWKHVI